MLWISHEVGNASGAVTMLPSIPQWAFAAMVVGGIWLCLWNSRVRLLGIMPFAIGAVGAALSTVPDLLVTNDGMHLAVVSADGRPAILRDRTGDFVQQLMAESSGYDGEPEFLSEAPFADCSNDSCVAEAERGGRNWRILATRSRNTIAWADLTAACAQADIAVSDRRLPRGCNPKWLKLDRTMLRQTGGVAIYVGANPRMEIVAAQMGEHPWAQLNSGGTPHRKFVPRGIDKVEATPAGKGKYRPRNDRSGGADRIEGGFQVVDPDHRQNSR